jgi:hypothetical protein
LIHLGSYAALKASSKSGSIWKNRKIHNNRGADALLFLFGMDVSAGKSDVDNEKGTNIGS